MLLYYIVGNQADDRRRQFGASFLWSIDMTATAAVSGQHPSLAHPVIILGRDDRGKPHASFFPAIDAHAARQAATRMGMFALNVVTDETRGFLPTLPKGKLFDSGKAFVPFVKQDTYQRITAHLPEDQRVKADEIRTLPEQPEAAPVRPDKTEHKPEGWDKIIVGSIVLATEGPLEGWYEARVLKQYEDNRLRLEWRDYPEEPAFTRRIDQLALLHPNYSEK